MSDNILLDSDNATIDSGVHHEFVTALVPAQSSAGCRSPDVHFKEQQGTVQVFGGWGQAILESIPCAIVLYLHVYVHSDDVIVCYRFE